MADDKGQRLGQLQATLRAAQLSHERAAKDPVRPLDAAGNLERDRAYARGMKDIYRQLVAYEKDLCQYDPRQAAFWGIAPATCQDLVQTLTQYPDTAILHYFVCEERVLIFLTTAEETCAVHAEISKQELVELVQRYRQLIETEDMEWLSTPENSRLREVRLNDIARELYAGLIAPIEPSLPTDARLCIIPHGVLHYLPFNTLRTENERYLVEERELLYSVSGSVFDWCHTQTIDRTNRSVAAFANPALPTWRDNLAMAEELARSLASHHPDVQLFVGTEAAVDAFWQYASTAGILALDLHSALNRDDPLETSLCLTPTEKAGGSLTLREIYLRGKGTLSGRLVVAAVCEGNLGEEIEAEAEDDLTTLARAFHYAGFATVITSLWRVHDLSAWLLMEAFYDELLQPKKDGRLAAGEALRSAQLSVAQMPGKKVLDRCRKQRERARAEDPHGVRAAWIDFSAIAGVEARCGNLRAAQSAYERARATFASATGDYGGILDVIDRGLRAFEHVQESRPPSLDYDRPIFAHPYYWGAFVLLGRWDC